MKHHRLRSLSTPFKVFFAFGIVFLIVFSISPTARVQANNTYHDLCAGNFTQNWTNINLITTDDDWSGVPSIIGYRGDGLASSTAVNPQTILTEGTYVIDVNANQTNPNTFTTGGVTEFHITDPSIALTGSGAARAPHIIIHLNTTGASNINIAYNLRDLDGSGDNSVQPVALQYRLGTTGNFTNIPAGFVADASTGPSIATLVTPVSVTLPVAAENQAQVQVRIITSDAVGADEWIGIDDINVSGSCAGDLPPRVSSTTPANGALNVSLNPTISVTFNETVTTTAGWYTVICAGIDRSAEFSNTLGSGTTHTLTYIGPNLPQSVTCTVTLNATNITDSASNPLDGNNDSTGGDNYVFSFTTESLTITPIHDIQGPGASSPIQGLTVTIQGVVTQVTPALNGFFIQEEDADVDADPATSEGIFVFVGASPTVSVGNLVTVRGTVTEFNNLTEITSPIITVNSASVTLPTPTTITLPIATYEDYERYEGMLVQFNGPLFVNDVYNVGRYGSFELSNSRIYNYTQVNAPNTAGYAAYQDQIEGRTILVDDGSNAQNPSPAIMINGSELSATNPLRAGYTVPSVTGVINFTFSEYVLYPTATVSFTASNPRATSAPAPTGTLRVASFNVLNYFNGDGAGGGFPTSRGATSAVEFDRQRAKTIATILGLQADIVGLLEMENDSYGPESAIQNLIDGLNSAGGGTCGPNWAFIDPGIPQLGTDEIKVALIYCAATVQIAPGTTVQYLNTPASVFVGANTNRVPLATTFQQISNGARLTVVVNHLKSKGGTGTGADLDIGDGQGSWNQRRVDAVNAITAWLAGDPTGSGDPDYILLGDFNAYAQENPITTLASLGYTNLVNHFAGTSNTHSYGFPNILGSFPEIQTWGTLDYAFANAPLLAQTANAVDWLTNADEPLIFDYNLEFKPTSPTNHQVTMYNNDPFRASDHDPIVVDLNLTVPPVVTPEVTPEITPEVTSEVTPVGTPVAGATSLPTDGTASPNIDVFDPAISKLGILLPGQTGVTGEQLEWVVTVSNPSSVAGFNVVVTDTLIPNLRIDRVEVAGGFYNVNGQTVTVTYGQLNPGQTVMFSIFTTTLDGATVNNTACVTADNLATPECTTARPIQELPGTGETPVWRQGIIVLGASMIVLIIGTAGWVIHRRNLR